MKKELLCKQCSEKLDEIEYYGIILYECPICGQLHDEYGDIISEEELKKKFITDENEKDELFPDRKESDEVKSYELWNEEIIKALDSSTYEEMFDIYNYADQEVRQEIEMRLWWDGPLEDKYDISSLINCLHNVYDPAASELITDSLIRSEVTIEKIGSHKSLNEPLFEIMKGGNSLAIWAAIFIMSYLDNKNILKKFITYFQYVKMNENMNFDIIFNNIKDKVSKNELSKLIMSSL